MEVIDVIPQGYCGGVRHAIKMALQVRKEHPEEEIWILGSLVHNAYVRQALEAAGIHTIEKPGATREELLDEISSGRIIFTAHGVSQKVYEKARKKGLPYTDASCPFVLQTQKIVQEKARKGYTIFYIGKYQHPEAEAIYLDNEQVILIQSEEDIPDDICTKIFVTNQTTMSVMDLRKLFAAIQKRYPDAEFLDELCNATRVRQEAILQLKHADALIVVGDPKSNNTRKLEETGKQAGIEHTFRIETAAQLDDLDLSQFQTIALTSGASTPTYLKNQVKEKLLHPEADTTIDPARILEHI